MSLQREGEDRLEEKGPVRVLIVDDSAYSRRTMTRMLEASLLVEVVGAARDGEDAMKKAIELEPDLITLDLEMPRMDGLTFLRLLMEARPTPVLVVSGDASEQDVFQALELGAVDFVAKPLALGESSFHSIQRSLLRSVHAVHQLRIDHVSQRLAAPEVSVAQEPEPGGPLPIVVIGASTGGPAALAQILRAFEAAPRCAVLVAQHMPLGFTQRFAARLDRQSGFDVVEAKGGEPLTAGQVFIAPGGQNLELATWEGQLQTRLSPAPTSDRFVPSVDRLFASAAKEGGERVLAVVLTGMGDDGREGACQVKAAGGRVISESAETAVIDGMPRQVAEAGIDCEVLPLGEIPQAISNRVSEAGVIMKQDQDRR